MSNPCAPTSAWPIAFACALIAGIAAVPRGAAAQIIKCDLRQVEQVVAAATRVPLGQQSISALCADILANIQLAPQTIAIQGGTVLVTASGFTGALFSRLDTIHQQGTAWDVFAASGGDGLMGLGYGGKSRAKQAGPVSGFSAYSAGTFLGGTRSGSPDLAGFDYDGTSGTAGLEYSVNRNLIVGVAGNYTSANADIDTGAAVDVGSLQAAAYISYATKHWFADALAAIGHHELDLARPGVTDTIRSSTDATTIALAARGAYLFDFGTLRVGPIAGLTYIRSRVDGYTETGDPMLTFNMPSQTLDTLTGSVGIRFLAPFMSGGNIVAPFLNVTLEHQFGDNAQTVSASLTQAPLVPILAPIPNFDTRTYGKVDGGVTFGLGPNVSATVNAGSTFARDEGNDYRVSAGFNYRF